MCESPLHIPAASPRRRALNDLAVAAVCLAVFVFCLFLFTRNNDFPLEYHPDEAGKVSQILSGSRNFNHPQLLLEATEWWTTVSPVDRDPQCTVIAGRQVSAFFAAAAAAMFAITAYLGAGWPGLIFAAAVFGFSPSLVIYSHYMKEDASLVFGIAAVTLTSRLVWLSLRWQSHLGAWALLAAACAIATSGKYVGAIALVMPLILLVAAPPIAWWRPFVRVAVFIPVFLLVLTLVNHRAFAGHVIPIASSLDGLGREVRHGLTQHFGLTAAKPHLFVLRTAAEATFPLTLFPAILLPAIVLVQRFRPTASRRLARSDPFGWELVFIAFFAVWAFALSFSAILFHRYALPLVVLIQFAGALALARLLPAIAPRIAHQIALGLFICLVLIASALPVCLDFTRQFAHDSRTELKRWAAVHLPPNARVYADWYADIHSPAFTDGRPDVIVDDTFFIPDRGTIEEFAATGDCYIVICSLSYNRFFEPLAVDAPGYADRNAAFRKFYGTLLNHRTPIWSATPTHNSHAMTNPSIRVYHLTEATP